MDKYEQIRNSLQTFDILNCVHHDWFWRLIGHVAMVVRMPGDILMVWESTSRNKWAEVAGTQINLMSDWVENYPGDVFVRRTFVAPEYKEDAESRLMEYIEKYRGKPYPAFFTWPGMRYMLNQVLDLPIPGPWNNDPNTENRDCSDRVAHTLQYCGLLDPRLNCSEVEPDNFRQKKFGNWKIAKYLLPGVTLGNEEQIK